TGSIRRRLFWVRRLTSPPPTKTASPSRISNPGKRSGSCSMRCRSGAGRKGRWLLTPASITPCSEDRMTRLPAPAAASIAVRRWKFPLTWLGAETPLGYNQVRTRSVTLSIAADQIYSQPFWLAQPKTGSAYTIDRQEMRDKPDSPPYHVATFEIQAGAERIE